MRLICTCVKNSCQRLAESVLDTAGEAHVIGFRRKNMIVKQMCREGLPNTRKSQQLPSADFIDLVTGNPSPTRGGSSGTSSIGYHFPQRASSSWHLIECRSLEVALSADKSEFPRIRLCVIILAQIPQRNHSCTSPIFASKQASKQASHMSMQQDYKTSMSQSPFEGDCNTHLDSTRGQTCCFCLFF